MKTEDPEHERNQKVAQVKAWVCSKEGVNAVDDAIKQAENIVQKLKEVRKPNPESLKKVFGVFPHNAS